MRALNGFCIALLSVAGLFAQYRANPTPYMTGGFGNVLYPGGVTNPATGIVRFPPNVAYPGGGGPRLNVPYTSGYRRSSRSNGGAVYSYPYPVYVGNYSDYGSGYGAGYADPSAAPLPQAAATPGTATPIIINIGVPSAAAPAQPAPAGPPEAYQQQAPGQDDTGSEPSHYLIALKDHTIYSAVAYWVDGSTLHYFTSGNVHNQVSLSLVDRELTERLNKETGLQVNLPK